MKIVIITLFTFLITLTSIAQKTIDGVEKKITKINLLYPSFEQETKLSKTATLVKRVGLNVSLKYGDLENYYNSDGSQKKVKYVELIPMLEIYYKWYYDLLKRQEKYKKTINNSASYLFSGVAIITPGIVIEKENSDKLDGIISSAYGGFGFRRTISRKIIFDVNIRYAVLMYNFDEFDLFNIIPGFKIGFRIDHKPHYNIPL